MWRFIADHLPSVGVLVWTGVSLAVPLFFTWLVHTLHQLADPPWLRQQNNRQGKESNKQKKKPASNS